LGLGGAGGASIASVSTLNFGHKMVTNCQGLADTGCDGLTSLTPVACYVGVFSGIVGYRPKQALYNSTTVGVKSRVGSNPTFGTTFCRRLLGKSDSTARVLFPVLNGLVAHTTPNTLWCS